MISGESLLLGPWRYLSPISSFFFSSSSITTAERTCVDRLRYCVRSLLIFRLCVQPSVCGWFVGRSVGRSLVGFSVGMLFTPSVAVWSLSIRPHRLALDAQRSPFYSSFFSLLLLQRHFHCAALNKIPGLIPIEIPRRRDAPLIGHLFLWAVGECMSGFVHFVLKQYLLFVVCR